MLRKPKMGFKGRVKSIVEEGKIEDKRESKG